MATENPIHVLVLEEFRLREADSDGAVARIVAARPHGIEPAIPLLTSIEDRRDVATVRALHTGETDVSEAVQHAALDPLVESWEIPKQYGPRITERSQSPASSFRLAVTESGINRSGMPAVTLGESAQTEPSASRAIGLVWIGAPVGTYGGLLVLLGTYEDPLLEGSDTFGWPLPLSKDLGVRIYENRRA